ncbi:SGS domain-containing protein [Podospora australis]|uniref:SGS domain-containing protein n=1 Tax=Podospora australis TaxID=1536484 RepID=A0AAN7AFX3_9PEZI|nr:SGS domain-containing protein [Podospora australis]
MSATTLAQKGIEALNARDYAGAIPLLDKALEQSNSPVWLLARSQAHTQLKNYDAALHDAELAYHIAAERGSGNSRKLMIDAQHRRSVVYFRQRRYADADCCAKWSMLLAEGRPAREDDGVEKNVDAAGNYTVTVKDAAADKENQPDSSPLAGLLGQAQTASRTPSQTTKTGFETEWRRAYAWRSQVLGNLEKLPENDPGRKVSVTKIPTKPQPKKEPKPEAVDDDSDVDLEKEKSQKPEPSAISDDKLKLRVDFYQSSQNVTISIFAKDIQKDALQVDFSKTQVQISPLPRAAAPQIKGNDPRASSTFILAGEIDPSASHWRATPQKIELVLQKATPGVKWGSWGTEMIGASGASSVRIEAADAPKVESKDTVTGDPAPAVPSSKSSTLPAYPTSSKSGPKDWEKLGVDDDDEDKQDVNGFFKQLYKDATPEARRAMMKSFIESNGTALSTDWGDVKDRKVETVPPEGVEVKKWKD